MSGRFEHTMKINQATEENMKGYPDIIKRFYRRSTNLTASSRHVIINSIIRFFNYLEEEGFDTYDEDLSWLEDITVDTIMDYIDSIKVKTLKNGKQKVLTDKTISSVVSNIDTFFTFLIKQKIIKYNVVEEAKDLLPKYKTNKKVVYMTPEEVKVVKERILKTSKYPKRDVCIFMLGCRTGLRQSAITEIDISDIDFNEMTIRVVEKGNVEKDVYIDPDTIRLIEECIEERGDVPGEDALFLTNVRRQRIAQSFMNDFFQMYAIDLNKKITPHKMRATCATNLYIQTGDIYAVADRLGHRNIENTKRYTDVAKKSKEAAKIMGQLF